MSCKLLSINEQTNKQANATKLEFRKYLSLKFQKNKHALWERIRAIFVDYIFKSWHDFIYSVNQSSNESNIYRKYDVVL